jgi:hypothetical protein
MEPIMCSERMNLVNFFHGKISIIVRFLTYRQRNMAFSNNHIGRSHPIGEAMDGKISIVVRFLTYRQRNMVFSNKRKLKGKHWTILTDVFQML